MAEEIVDIQTPIMFDESITHYEIHAHQPYASSTYENSDEIRISIQHQDLSILPSKSSLHICGKLTKEDGKATATTKLVNNAICHLFEEVRYELNAVEIDRNKNVGVTSLIKGLTSLTPAKSSMLENSGWIDVEETKQIVDLAGNFDICIPLSMLLGFAEDYRKIVVNAKHELILTRSRTDHNAVIQTTAENYQLSLRKIEWLVPYVTVGDQRKIQLLKFIAKDTPISMSYRTWELYEYPMLPATSKHVWSVKTSTQLEKPRYVILAMQTGRKNSATKNASAFDHCNITDVKLYLNSQCYPYGNMNLNIQQNQYALLYEMYTNFQSEYYGREAEPWLSKTDFLQHAPLIVIDCSKQNDSLKSGPVDVRLEFETKTNIPAHTCAYCLILHDRVVEYKPLSGGVKKLV